VALALEQSQFGWTPPFLVAPSTLAPEAATGYRLNAVSCGSPSMCVAVDSSGHAFVATDPAGGGEAWHSTTIENEAGLTSIVCPATTLCVVADGSGNIITSTNPTAPAPTWAVGPVTPDEIDGLACAGTQLCVAVDTGGGVSTSTNPLAGASSWRDVSVDPIAAPLTSVSCVSSSLCVATDIFGDVLTSHDPSGGVHAWEVAAVDNRALTQISCPAATLCVALDEEGNILISTNVVEGGRSWRYAGRIGGIFPSSLDCPDEDRCIVTEGGDAVISDFPSGGSETWIASTVTAHESLSAVACPTVTQCVAVDSLGHAIIGNGSPPVGTLNVSIGGSGRGAVTGGGISCPSSCSSSYPRGTPVTLSATPSPGSVFSGWGGSCAGSASCTLPIGRVTEVSAVFGLTSPPPGYALTITIGGSGAVAGPDFTCPPTCGLSLALHQTISVTARPTHGWRFRGWSGACEGSSVCRLTGKEAQSLKALFVPTTRARIQITRIRVDQPDRSASIDFKAVPANSTLVCALKRRGKRGVLHYQGCRSRIVYRTLARGVYVFLVHQKSNPAIHTSHEFLVK
jgi:hypothetical protein